MKYLTSLKSSFIFRESGLGFRLVELLSPVKSERGSICWHRLFSWVLPGNQTGHRSCFITGMPHDLTQQTSSGMRMAEKREEETDPSVLLRCFKALSRLQRSIQQANQRPWRKIGPLQRLFLWSFSPVYGHGQEKEPFSFSLSSVMYCCQKRVLGPLLKRNIS